jgi:peptidoglycan/LPS O-acetylase OafA/YrhL
MGTVRILLALWVVCTHGESLFGREVPQAWIAVQCFFIISGFYMSLILNEKYTGPGSTGLFLTNRFLRLFPVYWAALLLSLAANGLVWSWSGVDFGALQAWHEHGARLSGVSAAVLAFANLFLFGQNEMMFLGLDEAGGSLDWTSNFNLGDPKVWRFLFIPQAWSIEIELLFYLLAPFLLRRSLRALLVVLGLSFAIRAVCYGVFRLTFDPWTYRFFPNELGLFLLGAVSYRIYRAPWRERFSEGMWVHALALLFLTATIAMPFIPLRGQIKAWPYYALATVTIPFLFAETKNWRWDRYVGELSYPIYLIHFLVVHLCALALPQSWQWNRSFWAMIGSVLASILLVRWVVEPLERRRQARLVPARRRSRPSPRRLASPAASLGSPLPPRRG